MKETPDHYRLLKTVGLNRGAIDCYRSLCEQGSGTATELAERLQRIRSGLYRDLKRLEDYGFVVALKTNDGPTYFYRETVDTALQRLADVQRQRLKPIIMQQYATRHEQQLARDFTNHQWEQTQDQT